MKKSVRIQEGLLNHRLSSYLLDFFVLFLGTFILYLVIINTLFNFGFNYYGLKNEIKEYEQFYNLNLEEGLDYELYEEVVQDIYLKHFSKEIEDEYKRLYNEDFSATHIYNIVILKLPVNPTFDNYKTDLYQYAQKSDGTFDPDTIGKKIEGSGINYERNMESLFYSAYQKMPKVVESYVSEYFDLNNQVYNYESYSRMIGFIIVFVVWFLIIPLCNDQCATLFDKKFNLGHVNLKNGYYVKKYKMVIRNVLMVSIPFIGISILNKYSVVILVIGFILLECLLMLFSKERLGIVDKILRIETCSVSESLLFFNKKEEDEFLASEEGSKINDVDFMNRLEQAETINIVSYDEGDVL